MEQSELQRRVGEILAAEEADEVDWTRVHSLSNALNEEVMAEGEAECPDGVLHFLDDADIRQRDPAYAARQRDMVRPFVERGEWVEHAPSEPWTACLPVALALLFLVAWILA